MNERIDETLLETLKSRVKLEEVIAETEPLVGQGRFRKGQKHDSLVVDVDRQIYYWNSQSDRPGDVFSWLMLANGWNFKQAVADVAHRTGMRLDLDQPRPPSPPPRPLSPRTTRRLAAPPKIWQSRGQELVIRAQQTLWSPTGEVGLAELHRRGLSDETIRRAGVGWNPHHLWDEPTRWGFDGGRQVWLPRGLVVPWIIGDELWRLRVRRPKNDLSENEATYYSPRLYPTDRAGYVYDHEALYNADALRVDRPSIILEGEFDCLSVAQAVADLVTPVATGSVSGARRLRWITRLARCSTVLVAFDADRAGDRHAAYWLQVLPNARRWRPFWEDANQMGRDGVDLRAWIMAGLPETPNNRPFPLTIRWPATHPEAAMPPTWRRHADGRLEAIYYSVGELEESVQTLVLVQAALDLGGVCPGHS
jgi:DNA primase